MCSKKTIAPILGVVFVISMIAFLLFWYSFNQTLVDYSTKTEIPSQLTQWVDDHIECFSDEQWLLSNGYQKSYHTIRESDVYVRSYTHSPSSVNEYSFLDSPTMGGCIFQYQEFQKGLPVTAKGECVRYFPIDTYWLFHMEEYKQTEPWIYRFVFSQETGASIEIEIVIDDLPQEEHEATILKLLEQL